MRTPPPSLLTLGVAFAAGALFTYWLAGTMNRRPLATAHDDVLLREHVRARLADLVSYPDAIDVTVAQGVVRVSGNIVPDELPGLLMHLTGLPGVHKVHNALSTSRNPRVLANLQAPGATPPV